MANAVTLRDVLYALEYLHDAMVRTPISDGKYRWNMRAGGQVVKDSVANAVCASGRVSSIDDFGTQIIVWRAAA